MWVTMKMFERDMWRIANCSADTIQLQRNFHAFWRKRTRNKEHKHAFSAAKSYEMRISSDFFNCSIIKHQFVHFPFCKVSCCSGDIHLLKKQNKQKWPSRGVLKKRCSENLLYWNHISTWVFSSKFAAYFNNTFS